MTDTCYLAQIPTNFPLKPSSWSLLGSQLGRNNIDYSCAIETLGLCKVHCKPRDKNTPSKLELYMFFDRMCYMRVCITVLNHHVSRLHYARRLRPFVQLQNATLTLIISYGFSLCLTLQVVLRTTGCSVLASMFTEACRVAVWNQL